MRALGRRAFLAGAAALAGCRSGLVGTAEGIAGPIPPADPGRLDAARQLLASALTIDMHSHAGRILRRAVIENLPFEPLAAPMRAGGMKVACLAISADSPTTHITPDRRIEAVREPRPGELKEWGDTAFARVLALAAAQQLPIVTDSAGLRRAAQAGPAIIVAAEGADFLEGSLDGLDAAYERFQLRHLQLTHYRVNPLGDIQTVPAVAGGLTEFGAAVIRACNRRGIVVDVAHGPYELVLRAASVTTKPLILSHTSLRNPPRPLSRPISPDHARAVAATGGVIGIWPPRSIFPDLTAMAEGFARMADIVGVAHVGLGSDMRGLTGPSVFDSYEELPLLAERLSAVGFTPGEVGAMLGGNYARVFEASVG